MFSYFVWIIIYYELILYCFVPTVLYFVLVFSYIVLISYYFVLTLSCFVSIVLVDIWFSVQFLLYLLFCVQNSLVVLLFCVQVIFVLLLVVSDFFLSGLKFAFCVLEYKICFVQCCCLCVLFLSRQSICLLTLSFVSCILAV